MLATSLGFAALGVPTPSAAMAYDALTDAGSMYSVTRMTGARDYWRAGFTGKGVDVALIDTGTVPIDGLAAPGKLVAGPDLSFESQAPKLTRLDTFGHGTHMAGIIGGRATAATAGTYADDTRNFLGVAPDARIVSIKVADSNGATDVTQVIAAIDWVVQHRNDPGLNIRVLNLSYGTDTDQSYTVDPLAYAVDQAWRAGIFVVAAAGNAGFQGKHTGSITSPAVNPQILAVGALDAKGTLTPSDDTVPAFSSSGSGLRRPDMVAPGAHIVSLRVPGSFIDQRFGATGTVSPSAFRGSGTSQSAAVVSGAAALVIQQRPGIAPAELKTLLAGNADKLNGIEIQRQGAGALNLRNVLNAPTQTPKNTKAKALTGAGSLERSRGSSHVIHDGVALTGERDIFAHPLDSAALAITESAARAWSGGVWNGSTWSGSTWSSGVWSGSTWSGSTWSGSTWSGSTWSGSTWSGSTWSGSTWSDSRWSGSTWSGENWAEAGWA